MRTKIVLISALLSVCALSFAQAPANDPSEWRTLDPQNTLYMELESGRIIIELAPQFAPNHVDNIRKLVRATYFDNQRINRVQDNFVAQWGDSSIGKPLRDAKRTLPAEFMRPAKGLNFTLLPDPDTYAAQVGFVDGFPAGRESETG
ncbi:MAG TPA: peptidylprolyl isomerase [Steroidobacteraceae bacterium]|nr:peptidylprolyl isomerase [Steroidobacteraceae bacterium]